MHSIGGFAQRNKYINKVNERKWILYIRETCPNDNNYYCAVSRKYIIESSEVGLIIYIIMCTCEFCVGVRIYADPLDGVLMTSSPSSTLHREYYDHCDVDV